VLEEEIIVRLQVSFSINPWVIESSTWICFLRCLRQFYWKALRVE